MKSLKVVKVGIATNGNVVASLIRAYVRRNREQFKVLASLNLKLTSTITIT